VHGIDKKHIKFWLEILKQRETWWEGGDWLHLAPDRDLWQTLVKMVMNLWVT